MYWNFKGIIRLSYIRPLNCRFYQNDLELPDIDVAEQYVNAYKVQ